MAGITVLAPTEPSASEPSRFPLWWCHQALASACAYSIGASGIAHSPQGRGKSHKHAEPGRRWVKGAAHPHPSPHQLRLTGPGPPRAGRVYESSSLAGSRSRGSRSTVTDRKTRISPEPPHPRGKACRWSKCAARRALPVIGAIVAEGEWGGGCEHRDKESSGHGESACFCGKPHSSWK